MNGLVRLKVTLAGKPLAALRAVEGSFSRVNALVLFQKTPSSETLPALYTAVHVLQSAGGLEKADTSARALLCRGLALHFFGAQHLTVAPGHMFVEVDS